MKKTNMPGRLTLAIVCAGLGIGVVRFALRTMLAAWLVFPPPLPNPDLPPTLARPALLQRAASYAPGEAHYHYWLAQLHHRQFRARWLDAAAVDEGMLAAAAIEEAVGLIPTNPYYHRLAGSISLDLGRHPEIGAPRARELVGQALAQMNTAVSLAPSSPLLNQQVGLELLRSWESLDPSSRQLTLRLLRRAADLDSSDLPITWEAVHGRFSGTARLALLDEITPETAAARASLAGFLERKAGVAARLAPGSEQQESLQAAALETHLQAAELADFELRYLDGWLAAHQRLRPAQPERALAFSRGLADRFPQRIEPRLLLAAAASLAGRGNEEMLASAEALTLATAQLDAAGGGADADGRARAGARSPRRGASEALAAAPPVEDRLRYAFGLYQRALRGHADLVYREGRWDQALELYQQLAAVDPEDHDPLIRAGRCLDALGRHGEAMERYELAVRIAPRSSEARSALANAYVESHEVLAAIEQWRTMLAWDPRAVAPRIQIARAYAGMGLFDQAVRALSEGLDRAPDEPRLRSEMDAILRQRRQN